MSVANHLKVTKLYFLVVLFIIISKVVIALELMKSLSVAIQIKVT